LRLSDRAKRDEDLRPEIEPVFSGKPYETGVRRIWHQMRREDFGTGRSTIAKLMKNIGIEGVIHAKRPGMPKGRERHYRIRRSRVRWTV